jgi:rod shape-determining protein MreD
METLIGRRCFFVDERSPWFHVKPSFDAGAGVAHAAVEQEQRRTSPLPPFALAWDTAAERHRRRRSSEVTHEAGRDPGLAEDRPTMTLLVAAIAATVAAILESTITQYLRVGDAQPHIVFVLAVIWTVAAGLDSGLVWAFVGGIALDTLAQRPLGSTAFALLIVVGATSVLARTLARVRPIVTIIATAPLSLAYSMTLVLLFSVLRPPAALSDPLRIVLPSVIYDVIVAAILGPLIVSIRDRFADEERAPR